MGVNAHKKHQNHTKRARKHDFDDLDEAILANYSRQANATSFNYRHQQNTKLNNIQEFYTPESLQKVETDDEKFAALLESFALYDDEYQSLEAKQKQIEVEHNTTQQDVQSQFDQISQEIQSYQSKLNEIHKRKDQSSSQIKLFQKTISEIDALLKKRGSVHLNSGQFIKLCNEANHALAVIDENLQLFCTDQGKGSHITLQTHLRLNDCHDCHKTTVCSNTRVGHIRDTFNRIVHILNESQQEKTELSREEQTQEEQINMEMENIIQHQIDIVNETKIKLGALEQKILSLKTNMSQLKKQKRNILSLLESMVDGNDFVTRRFDQDTLQTYYIIQFYANTVLPLLIEQRVRWYVSCYSKRAALLYDPFVELNFTCMKLQLFDVSDEYLADKYNASIHSGLQVKNTPWRTLQVLYQRGNEKLSAYMKQIESATKHIGLFVNSIEMILEQIQEQLTLKLRSSTLPCTHLKHTIHDSWKHSMYAEIDCSALDDHNTSIIMFHNFTLIGDILDTRRHMFSFAKKQYDTALYYQKSMNKLKKLKGQDLNVKIKLNLLEWSILYDEAYMMFLKVKALGIDPTEEMMKSAFGFVTHRVVHLKEEEIDSIEFYQQIINKTYIDHWQNSTAADTYQRFINEILPFLAQLDSMID